MPQPTLFEATCIAVIAVSQERLVKNAGEDRSKILPEIYKATVSPHNYAHALFSGSISRMSILKKWKGG
jgi:hypothetical protein